MGRGGLLNKAQVEIIAVYVMALLLVLMVGVTLRFVTLYRQAREHLEEKSREMYQVMFSGGLRGRIDDKSNTIYLSSGTPVDVYVVMIYNGTHILWSNPELKLVKYPQYEIQQFLLMVITNFDTPVYQGPLTQQVMQCRAWVTLVTDKGLLKWCPQIVTKVINNTITTLIAPMNPIGMFKVYYVGNISFYGFYGILSKGIDQSKTVLYPLAVLYTDPLIVSEKWNDYMVNVTVTNPITEDVAWIVFDVSTGTVVNKKNPSVSSNTYYMFLALPSTKNSIIASINPISIGGIDFFIFTAYYNSAEIRSVELFTGTSLSINVGKFIDYISGGACGNYYLPCSSFWYTVCIYSTSTRNFGDIYVGVLYPLTMMGSFTIFKQLNIDTSTTFYYSDLSNYGDFSSKGSSLIQMSYIVHSSLMNNPIIGTGTSWNACTKGYYSSIWFYVKARSSLRIPSGRTVEVGLNITVQVSTEAQPSTPPTTTPTHTPVPPSWLVQLIPMPTSTIPTNTTVVVFTLSDINISEYKIWYRIDDKDIGRYQTDTVSPVYLGLIGRFGRIFELEGGTRKVIEIKVYYRDKVVFSYSTYNYLPYN